MHVTSLETRRWQHLLPDLWFLIICFSYRRMSVYSSDYLYLPDSESSVHFSSLIFIQNCFFSTQTLVEVFFHSNKNVGFLLQLENIYLTKYCASFNVIFPSLSQVTKQTGNGSSLKRIYQIMKNDNTVAAIIVLALVCCKHYVGTSQKAILYCTLEHLCSYS